MAQKKLKTQIIHVKNIIQVTICKEWGLPVPFLFHLKPLTLASKRFIHLTFLWTISLTQKKILNNLLVLGVFTFLIKGSFRSMEVKQNEYEKVFKSNEY
jgi:hypothetical protein